jgi:chromosomal replication initiator protein
MWLARRFTRSALSEIGRYFGGRSHSTVIAAERRVENWVARRERVAMPQGAFEIDDAIRRVERALWQASA